MSSSQPVTLSHAYANTALVRETKLDKRDSKWVGKFMAMSCPCELIACGCTEHQARRGLQLVSQEAWRLERKFSRFTQDSVVGQINQLGGRPVVLDSETQKLLDCANTLYELSEGLFDITSGVLAKLWRFDGTDQVPSQAEIDKTMKLVGWGKVDWNTPILKLRAGMQIDFGGIGKEYAADRCRALGNQVGLKHLLVNLGGDISASPPLPDEPHWNIGVENIQSKKPDPTLQIFSGGVATSGDQRRYIMRAGQRYSHILNPKTGWPISSAPKSVTVQANSASEAGMFSTLAMLLGSQAESVLQENQLVGWVQR